MILKPLAVVLLAAAFCPLASAAVSFNTYSATFVEVAPGEIKLEGFGRSTADSVPGLSFDSELAPLALTELFIDTWNIDTSGIAPGSYAISQFEVQATGGVVFDSVIFNSVDGLSMVQSFPFIVSAGGTLATGSGTFTVLANCPLQPSCVWINVVGTQPVGAGAGVGYNPTGDVLAAVVPEPASWALLALGLAAVGGIARRARA